MEPKLKKKSLLRRRSEKLTILINNWDIFIHYCMRAKERENWNFFLEKVVEEIHSIMFRYGWYEREKVEWYSKKLF